MIKESKYIKLGKRVFEIVGKDGEGRPVTKLTDLKEIPEPKEDKKKKDKE
jgi:hypothetical protein